MIKKGFVNQARNTLLELRSSTTAVISSIGIRPLTGTELSKSLGIDKTLAWKLIKIVDMDDVFLASQYIPGHPSYTNFLVKAAKKGANKKWIKHAEAAYEGFLNLIKHYTGDRVSLDLMLQGASSEGCLKAFFEQKKACFLAQRFLNGVSASVSFLTLFVLPDSEGLSTVHAVKGFVRLLRFRENPISLYKIPVVQENQEIQSETTRKPLFPSGTTEGESIPYFVDFCSCEMPQPGIDCKINIDNIFPEIDLGANETVDLVTAESITTRGFNVKVSQKDKPVNPYQVKFIMNSNFPVETLLMDVFVHEDARLDTPEISVSNSLTDYSEEAGVSDLPESGRLIFDENVIHAGKGVFCAQIPEIPWYSDMIQSVFSRIKEDDEVFNLFRVKIPYPYLPSRVTLDWN